MALETIALMLGTTRVVAEIELVRLAQEGYSVVSIGCNTQKRYWLESQYDEYMKNNPAQSAKILEREVKRSPGIRTPWMKLGQVYCTLGAWRRAARAFQRVVKIDGEYPEGRYWKGLSYVRCGWFKAARKEMEVLEELDYVLYKELEEQVLLGEELQKEKEGEK
jgi:uncharacterized protein HemY